MIQRTHNLVLILTLSAWLAGGPPASGQTAGSASPDAISDAMDSLLDFSAAPVQPPEPAETNRVKLLHKQASALRDPFWPVGYTPPRKDAPKPTTAVRPMPQTQPEPTPVERPPKWDEALRTVSVKGIMSVGEGKYMAVVNDQVVGENDTVAVAFEGRRYTWRITRITADGVKFQKVMATK
jgi:hypothetical protein